MDLDLYVDRSPQADLRGLIFLPYNIGHGFTLCCERQIRITLTETGGVAGEIRSLSVAVVDVQTGEEILRARAEDKRPRENSCEILSAPEFSSCSIHGLETGSLAPYGSATLSMDLRPRLGDLSARLRRLGAGPEKADDPVRRLALRLEARLSDVHGHTIVAERYLEELP